MVKVRPKDDKWCKITFDGILDKWSSLKCTNNMVGLLPWEKYITDSQTYYSVNDFDGSILQLDFSGKINVLEIYLKIDLCQLLPDPIINNDK